MIPSAGSYCVAEVAQSGGYKISAYERTASARRHFRELTLESAGISSWPPPKNDAMFASKPPEGGGIPSMAWGVAGSCRSRGDCHPGAGGKAKAAAPDDYPAAGAYAANLPFSQLAMSESTSLSGGKSTFIDGHIKNTGDQTVTGITVQVLFRNNEAMPPQIETLPLSLIRTREPYIDTQPVSAAPLKPGDEREFRLIFESLPANWNMQMPEIRIIQVDTK